MLIPLAGVLLFAALFLLLSLAMRVSRRHTASAQARTWLPASGSLFGGGPLGGSGRSIEEGEGVPCADPGGPPTPAPATGAPVEGQGKQGPPDLASKQDWYQKYRNGLVHGVTNWLDLCYAGVTYRCLQAFYEQWYGASVMGAAPTIGWWSPTHLLIFGLSVVITVVYVVGAPVCYSLVLLWGKKLQHLGDPVFKTRWGWMVNRYEYDFFWWHLTTFARRIIFSSIAVFGVHSPEIQVPQPPSSPPSTSTFSVTA